MYSEKEYQVKIRQLGRKVEKLEEKRSVDKETLSQVRLLNKRLRQRELELKEGRNNWKGKYKHNQQTIKKLKVALTKDEKVTRHHYGRSLISLCVLLRVKGGCSYRGVVRVLKVLLLCNLIEQHKLPCANTVQNWTSKVGLNTLQGAVNEPISEQVTLIVDECIRKGKEKQLIVLLAPFEKEKEESLTFQDVQVVHMEGAKSWKGKEIEKTLSFLKTSQKVIVKNVLSDEGKNLINFSNLSQLSHIPDIAHGVATCLKKTFLKDADYQSFMKLVATYIYKGVNQDFSYLCPPKLGKKARFMNQTAIVDWAEILTHRISQLDKKSLAFFEQLPQHSSMIKHLSACLDIGQRIQVPLKKQGANKKTLATAKQMIEVGKKQEGYVKTFVSYLDKYINLYDEFIDQHDVRNIHVSSDIIESLFGKYKSIANHSALTGLTKLNLELVIYCIDTNELLTTIPTAIERIFMTDLEQWVNDHSSDNQLIKRRNFFKKEPVKAEVSTFLN